MAGLGGDQQGEASVMTATPAAELGVLFVGQIVRLLSLSSLSGRSSGFLPSAEENLTFGFRKKIIELAGTCGVVHSGLLMERTGGPAIDERIVSLH